MNDKFMIIMIASRLLRRTIRRLTRKFWWLLPAAVCFGLYAMHRAGVIDLAPILEKIREVISGAQ